MHHQSKPDSATYSQSRMWENKHYVKNTLTRHSRTTQDSAKYTTWLIVLQDRVELKAGSLRGRTKHTVLSSHSGVLPPATKHTKKRSRKTLNLRSYTTSSESYFVSLLGASAHAFKGPLFFWQSEGRDTKNTQNASPAVVAFSVLKSHLNSFVLTISPRNLSWTDFRSFLIVHIWKQHEEQQGFWVGKEYDPTHKRGIKEVSKSRTATIIFDTMTGRGELF